MDHKPANLATSGANSAALPALQGSPTDAILRRVLTDVLGIDAHLVEGFDADTGLFGHLPELDSMAVATLLTEMEDRFDIVIEDDEVDGELLETYGNLLAFAEAKRNHG